MNINELELAISSLIDNEEDNEKLFYLSEVLKKKAEEVEIKSVLVKEEELEEPENF